MREQKVELLAPAGSYEGLKAVCHAGADAVYIGGNQFGARAYANNLDRERMLAAIDEVHIHGKKLYLTVNTLLKNQELEENLYEYLLPYYEQGLDGVIVQDIGVLSFIRECFPDLPVHASTQMAVTGVESARFLKELGVSRIVTARELSLREIREIKKETDMEIESFVHGALCYCYSGMCLFSSILGGRSGNRGRCAQPCRLPYQVYENGKLKNGHDSSYPLSPKDMCTIELLPQILDAGVYSLKIEGRMKKPEYAAGVTSVYRKYLDLWMEHPDQYRVSQTDQKLLFDLYQRDGFNQGYYKVHNGRDMIAVKNEKQNKGKQSRSSEELYQQMRQLYVDTEKKEKIHGFLRLSLDSPATLQVKCGEFQAEAVGAVPQPAQKQPLSEERVCRQVAKLGNTPFVMETLQVEMQDDLFLPMQSLNELRRDALQRLTEQMLQPYRRKSFRIPLKEAAVFHGQMGNKQKICYTASVETREQLEAVLAQKEISRVYVNLFLFDKTKDGWRIQKILDQIKRQNKECYIALPYVVRKHLVTAEQLQDLIRQGAQGFLVRNLETYAILKKVGLEEKAVLDFHMYRMNDRAAAFWKKQSAQACTVPLELNQKEIAKADNHNSEMVIYGYYPLMISAQCVKKTVDGCTHKNQRLQLKDRYKQTFPVQCCCDACYNVIYNSLPTGLLKEAGEIKKLKIPMLRFSFTLEGKKETEDILKLFLGVYAKGEKVPAQGPVFTKGHLKRGVE
ncbi:MAG: DUF3656 domain-containing U32 family peptidase [Lachnospiraceae bacterium]|jgi:putative protease